MYQDITKKMLTIFINDTDRTPANIWEAYQREVLSERPKDGTTYFDTQHYIKAKEFLALDIKDVLGSNEWRAVNFVVVESNTDLPNEHVRILRDKINYFKPIINPPSLHSGIFAGLGVIVNFRKFSLREVTITKGLVTEIDQRF